MRLVIVHGIRFFFLIVLQTLVFNQLERFGIHPMIYPMAIMLLPFSTNPVVLLLLSFVLGFSIDLFSNTGGLHASSLLVFALFRPIIFKAFSPRDWYYPGKEGSIFEMGYLWFFYSFGTLLLIHHAWFFFMEVFKFSEILYVLKKLSLSLVVSFVLVVLLQFLFLKRRVEK